MRIYSTWPLLSTDQVLVTLFVEERSKLVRPGLIADARYILLHNGLCNGSQVTQYMDFLAYIRHLET
jgi:hypothetical protein